MSLSRVAKQNGFLGQLDASSSPIRLCCAYCAGAPGHASDMAVTYRSQALQRMNPVRIRAIASAAVVLTAVVVLTAQRGVSVGDFTTAIKAEFCDVIGWPTP